MIKHVGIMLFVIVVVVLAGMAEAATLHAILVADTTNPRGGDSMQSDLSNMWAFLNKIATNTPIPLNPRVFQGDSLTPDNVLGAVYLVDVNQDDVVFFYYAGHGASGSSAFPMMYFGGGAVDMAQVISGLYNKKPRLLIALADCCNVFLTEGMESAPFLPIKPINQESYHRLFLNSSGVVLAAGAAPGESAYGYSRGGIFTNAFLTQCEGMLDSLSPHWSGVSMEPLRTYASEQPYQHPIFDIKVNVIEKPSAHASSTTRAEKKYRYEGGYFSNTRKGLWTELTRTKEMITFHEVGLDGKYIILFDSRRNLYVALPQSGGMSFWRKGTDSPWSSLHEVNVE